MNAESNNRQNRGAEAESSAPLTIHRPDIYVAAVVLVICAALFARTFWFAEVPSSLAQNVQPALFPRLVLIVIAAIALWLPFEYHRKLARGIDLDAERRDPLGWLVPVTALALVVFVAAMPWLGAYPALLMVTAGLPILWGERRWKILLPYVVIFPLLVLFLFSEVLQVTFPRGLVGSIFR